MQEKRPCVAFLVRHLFCLSSIPQPSPKCGAHFTERIPSVGEIPLFVRYNYLMGEVVAVIIVGALPTVRCIMITLPPPEP